MQPRNPPAARANGGTSGNPPNSNSAARPSTNNDASHLLQSQKRMSFHSTAANTPLPQSPALHSPRFSFVDAHPRSPSATLSRPSSPALRKKSSNSSLRGDVPTSPRAPLPRRGSFIPNMPSPAKGSPLVMEEKPPLRACDIAEEYFRKELALHDGMAGATNAGTIVVIHDQCYGHRFSRPKTPKVTLNTIMERPERMLASVRGISAAYVRLGERHSDAINAPRPNQNPSSRIPFKIRKTSRAVDLTSQVVTNVHGTKWMEEFKSLCDGAEQKLASSGKELARDPPTIPGQPSKPAFHPMDLYLAAESRNAIQGALGGVLDAVDAVFQGSDMENGVSRAFVCIRPPGHHCSAEWPSGFCWINNVHVGIEHAMANYGLTHAAIIDFDLHHGDGSQDITWERNKKVQTAPKKTPNWKKTSIGYFSLHDINSFPCEDGDDDKVQAASLCIDNAHGQSIWNIHLETWSTPEEFWRIYEDKYLVLLDKTRKYLKFHTNRLRKSPNHPAPKAAIFLSAGFDASEHEASGMQRHTVNVPTEFYARFTRDVVRLAEEVDTGVDGRIISVLEGGYSDRALASGVLSHLSGLCDGQVWSEPAKSPRGLGFDLEHRLNGLSMYDPDVPMSSTTSEPTLMTYDTNWWHVSRLEELEHQVTPLPYVAPRKVEAGPQGHFSSPTQSFTAKVVDPTKLIRTVSGRYQPAIPSRVPTPPPPEVDWATATHALSKLLIPSDRQTKSFKPEELAEPKVKKEKPAPVLNSVHIDPSGRQLRGRKPATYADPGSDDEKASARAESRASRRQTIADLPIASIEPPDPKRTVSRRVSIASSMGSEAPERSLSRASTVVPGRRSVAPALPANGVQVKKARSTTAMASRVPKNTPPVPSVPSQFQAKPAASKQKENENEMDQLTSGLKRITLKLPSREEHDAREAEKKARTATRKPAAPRATKTTTKPPPPKKAVGRPPKALKLPFSVEPKAATASPEPPQLQSAVAAPLEQPKPVVPAQAAAILKHATVEPGRRQSSTSSTIDPPTELVEMTITPEDLPRSVFVMAEGPVGMTTSPPRPDTPPPPPPAMIPGFVNYTTHTFGTPSLPSAPLSQVPTSAPSQWLPPNSDTAVPAKPTPRLPVFSPHGVIPFASEPKEEASDVWDVPDTPAPTH